MFPQYRDGQQAVAHTWGQPLTCPMSSIAQWGEIKINSQYAGDNLLKLYMPLRRD